MHEHIYEERDCEDYTVYVGYEGDWGNMIHSLYEGYYACGMHLRIEDNLGDDKSWTGLKLIFCDIDDWN